MTDTDLAHSIAEMLYDRSVITAGFDESPRWSEVGRELRDHWLGIAEAALSHVRIADGATIT